MKKIKNTFSMTVIFLILLSGSVHGQNAVFTTKGQLVASNKITREEMSISYNGHGKDAGFSRTIAENEIDTSLMVFEKIQILEVDEARIVPRNGFVRVGERVKELALTALQYVFYVDENESDAVEKLQKQCQTNEKVSTAGKMDFNFGVHVGMDDKTKDITIHGVKLSSWAFATHLDAVYNYKIDRIDLFFSNDLINQMLADGMTLDLQFNPQDTSGAFLINMKF